MKFRIYFIHIYFISHIFYSNNNCNIIYEYIILVVACILFVGCRIVFYIFLFSQNENAYTSGFKVTNRRLFNSLLLARIYSRRMFRRASVQHANPSSRFPTFIAEQK